MKQKPSNQLLLCRILAVVVMTHVLVEAAREAFPKSFEASHDAP